MPINRFAFAAFAATTVLAAAIVARPAAAEVRFGKNVRIGGNDVSNQTFNRQNRGLFVVHSGKPPNPGCRWRTNADGSRTKICHLQRR